MAREYTVKVQLSEDELEQLDELRGGVPRAVWLRQGIHKPPEVKDVASYEEALAILTSMARDGKVSAASDLEKALRSRDRGEAGARDPLAEVNQILRTKANDEGAVTPAPRRSPPPRPAFERARNPGTP